MVTPALLTYVKTLRERHVPEAEIRSTLLGVGWEEADVAEAFRVHTAAHEGAHRGGIAPGRYAFIGLISLLGAPALIATVLMMSGVSLDVPPLREDDVANTHASLMEIEKPTALPVEEVSMSSAKGEVTLAETLPAWKTLTLGTYPSSAALERALVRSGHSVSAYARDIFVERTIPVLTVPATTTLVRVDVPELVAGGTAETLEAVYARARARGLSLCPAETGPQLVLQDHGDDAPYEVTIAMEPLVPKRELVNPDGFNVFSVTVPPGQGARTLGAEAGSVDTVVSGRTFVFCR